MAAPTPPADPIVRFREVFRRACATGMPDPDAMVLSTADADGRPSSRVVLLKGFDERGFVFYTNLESRKGRQIAVNPHVSLNVYWRELDQQVIVQGVAERLSDEEADAYFATRPRGSQLGAWASRQSEPMPGRARLVADVAKLEARYLGRPVPRPPFWSGFRVVPRTIEFWVEGRFRLHDRTLYERAGDGWRATTLYP